LESFADGDELHLGCDLAIAGIVQLGDAPAGLAAQWLAHRAAELLGGRVRAPSLGRPAVVAGVDGAAVVGLDVAPVEDPRPAKRWLSRGRVGPRPTRVVEVHRLAVGQRHLGEWHVDVEMRVRAVDIDLGPARGLHGLHSLRRHYPDRFKRSGPLQKAPSQPGRSELPLVPPYPWHPCRDSLKFRAPPTDPPVWPPFAP